MRRRIMLVEDEGFQRNVLKMAIQRQVAGEEVEVEDFADPHQALARARQSTFAVVVADYRMPGMNGIAFLKNMRSMQPAAVRLMLTASADVETAVMAINHAEIFRFIRKPWDQDFRRAVSDALARHAEVLAETAPGARSGAPVESAQRLALRELELSDPGITRVRWGDDGSVLLQ